jgi:hypothetical protein
VTTVTRVQTGVRIEARLLNVLKALAALKGVTLGDLLEGIVLHAFDGQQPFSAPTLAQIAELKKIYGLDLTAADSHRLVEPDAAPKAGRATVKRPTPTAKPRTGRKR